MRAWKSRYAMDAWKAGHSHLTPVSLRAAGSVEAPVALVSLVSLDTLGAGGALTPRLSGRTERTMGSPASLLANTFTLSRLITGRAASNARLIRQRDVVVIGSGGVSEEDNKTEQQTGP